MTKTASDDLDSLQTAEESKPDGTAGALVEGAASRNGTGPGGPRRSRARHRLSKLGLCLVDDVRPVKAVALSLWLGQQSIIGAQSGKDKEAAPAGRRFVSAVENVYERVKKE
jgi:hypothetical protein